MSDERVRLLGRTDIDDARWNAAVADDAAPYPLTWWLDAVTAGKWKGLVLGDYRAVLPLPFRRRLGPLAVLGSPPFTQHLGSLAGLGTRDRALMLHAIPHRYRVRNTVIRGVG